MRHNPNFVAREIGDEMVLVPVTREAGDMDSVFALNEVAACVWSLIETCPDASAIAHELSAEFEVEEQQALADVEQLLAQLREYGAVIDG